MFKRMFRPDLEEPEVKKSKEPTNTYKRKEVPITIPELGDEEEIKQQTKEMKIKRDKPLHQVNPIKPATPAQSYETQEVISPIYGKKDDNGTKVTVKKTNTEKKEVKKRNTNYQDQIVPIISPFYGVNRDTAPKKEIEYEINKPKEKAETKFEKPAFVATDKFVDEVSEEVKIIEHNTGNISMDFAGDVVEEQEPTKRYLIDELDDTMPLDELLKLYESRKE